MNTTVNIPARAFQAALMHAGKGDVRFYLNGVYLDLPKGRIVATTGHTMFIGKIASADCPPVIVPRETVEAALKSYSKKQRESYDVEVTIEPTSHGCQPIVKLQTIGTSFAATAIDARFPEYERVVPTFPTPSGEYAQFQPEYVALAHDAIQTYSQQYKTFWNMQRNGLSAGLMAGPDCLVVVMPYRHGPDLDIAWFTGKPADVAEAA